MWKRISALLVALGVMSLAIATPVAAQPFDHLKCYKVKDPHKFEATADLVPRDDPPFAVEPGCRVKVTGKKLCVPVDKQLLATTAPVVEFPTAEASSDYLCYKVKCPKGAVPDLEVTDQFGTRTVSGLRAKEICTPAVKGPPPPFTCTDQTLLTCAQGSCPAGQACGISGLACACAPIP
jgi:hypothetical protein